MKISTKFNCKLSVVMYDEEIDLRNAEDIGLMSPIPTNFNNNLNDRAAASTSSSVMMQRGGLRNPARLNTRDIPSRHGSIHSDNSEEDDEDDDDVQAAPLVGLYDPSEYDGLQATEEIKEVFQMIIRYTPQNPEFEYKIYPFVPDFIPAVGDIDAFLKIPRPDGKGGSIGLDVLDEPSASQSEPAVLHLQLRAVAKNTSELSVVVKKVEGTETQSKAVDQWIKDISELHLTRPPPTVHYTRTMPDTDSLMQQWPPEFEEVLQELGPPPPDLDCDVGQYAAILCNLFGIPTYESRIESLHALFTLYSAVKSSQHNSDEHNAPVDGQVPSKK